MVQFQNYQLYILIVQNRCLTTLTAFTAYIYSIHVYISNGLVPELSTLFTKYRISLYIKWTVPLYGYIQYTHVYISNGLVPLYIYRITCLPYQMVQFHCTYIQHTCLYIKWFSSIVHIYNTHVYISNGLHQHCTYIQVYMFIYQMVQFHCNYQHTKYRISVKWFSSIVHIYNTHVYISNGLVPLYIYTTHMSIYQMVQFHCTYIQHTCLYIKWFSSIVHIYNTHVYISNGNHTNSSIVVYIQHTCLYIKWFSSIVHIYNTHF